MESTGASAGELLDRRMVPVGVATLVLLPGVVLRLSGVDLPAPVGVAIYAGTFVGAALLLTWGTELAQLDLPPGLAVAILALVAILPEYAVDLLFAWQAGTDPSKAPLALANMTGANRLLIGLGWSLVVLVAAVGARRLRRDRADGPAGSPSNGPPRQPASDGLALSRLSAVDIVLLGAVSLYALSFVVRRTLTLLDAALLLAAFGLYVYRLWKSPTEEPDFIGPPAVVSKQPTGRRRFLTVALLVLAAAVILLVAEPFSTDLVDAGKQLGVDEFLLVQWIAPLATETAELIPAAIFAYRQSADEGLGTLLSSKINQWTLLVGAIPIVFAISAGGWSGLPIDVLQRQELFLTAAQSVFAVSLLVDLRLGVREALAILTLFLGDFAASVFLSPDVRPWARFGFGGLYLLIAVVRLVQARALLPALVRDGLAVDPEALETSPAVDARR